MSLSIETNLVNNKTLLKTIDAGKCYVTEGYKKGTDTGIYIVLDDPVNELSKHGYVTVLDLTSAVLYNKKDTDIVIPVQATVSIKGTI